jgi:hypothetical protein
MAFPQTIENFRKFEFCSGIRISQSHKKDYSPWAKSGQDALEDAVKRT